MKNLHCGLGFTLLPFVTSIPFIDVTFLMESFIPANVILFWDASWCLSLDSNSDALLHVRLAAVNLSNYLVLPCIVSPVLAFV